MGSLAKYVVELSQNPAKAERMRCLFQLVRLETSDADLSPDQLAVLISNDPQQIAQAIQSEPQSAGAVPPLQLMASIIHP